MGHISWGKPRIFIKDLEASSPAFMEIPTPVEDSSVLNVTKGDKKEAKIEGGDYEDVVYKRNNYAFEYAIRLASGRTMPIDHNEGVVDHKYKVVLVPENADAPGFEIQRSTVSVEEGYNAADGASWKYVHDAIKPDSGEKLRWGTITVTESTGGEITITGKGMDFGDTPVTL